MKTQKEKKHTFKKQNTKNHLYDDFVMRSGEIPTIKFNKVVGSYKVGRSFYINFDKKPNFFHRFLTKALLGWTWTENK